MKSNLTKYFDFKSSLYRLFDISILFFIFTLLMQNSLAMIVAITMIILVNVIYSFYDVNKHIIFLGFNASLTFFLMSRFIVTGLLKFKFEYGGIYDMGYPVAVTETIIVLIGLSVTSYTLIYWLLDYDKKSILAKNQSIILLPLYDLFRIEKIKLGNISIVEKKSDFRTILRAISLVLFIVTVIFRIYVLYEKLQLVREIGYRASYLLGTENMTLMDKLIDIVSRMELAAFIVFLATKPKFIYYILPGFLFLIPGVINLFIGARGDIMLRFSLLLVLSIFRIKEKKIIKRIVLFCVIFFPLLIILFIVIEKIRGTETGVLVNNSSIVNKFARLFYNQGVSARTIGGVIQYNSLLPNKIYSLGTIIDFFRFSIFGRFNGLIEPTGQSIQVVMLRTELGQDLTFYQMPFEYLNKGIGVGSSYIAELFHDFGYVGVCLGSGIYGVLFYSIRKALNNDEILYNICAIFILKNLFFTPRASYSFIFYDMLNDTHLSTTILLLIFAYIVNYFMTKVKRSINWIKEI